MIHVGSSPRLGSGGLSIGSAPKLGSGASGPTPAYDAATTALLARMSVQPDAMRAGLIDDLIVGLKADGLWTKFDALWIIAAHDAQAGRLNWIANAFNLTTANAPTFTTDRGYAGDGSSSYINTNWIPSASSLFLQDSCNFGVWVNGGSTSGSTGVAAGCRGTTASNNMYYQPRTSSDLFTARIIDSTTEALTGITATTTYGLSMIGRETAGTKTGRRNTTDGSAVRDSTGRPETAPYLGGFNVGGALTNPVDHRFAAAWVSGGLNGTEKTALYNRLNTFLTAIGAN